MITHVSKNIVGSRLQGAAQQWCALEARCLILVIYDCRVDGVLYRESMRLVREYARNRCCCWKAVGMAQELLLPRGKATAKQVAHFTKLLLMSNEGNI